MAKHTAQRLGLEGARHRPPGPRRAGLLREHAISLVLDVGANRGQYAQELRAHGYQGRIVSFEPAPETFRALAKCAAGDPMWEARQLAASDRAGTVSLSQADNFSSLLPPGERLTTLFAQAAAHHHTPADAVRLDHEAPDLPAGQRTLLKLDVQGYERQALEGAAGILPAVGVIETELSLRTLYDGQALIDDVLAYLRDRGFALHALTPVLRDPRTGEYLQFDGLLTRR
jgi:FkbM family methyltransferase